MDEDVIEKLSHISRVQMLYSLTVANYNDTHKKFGIKFVEGDEKALIPPRVLHRINLANVFDAEEVKFDGLTSRCPTSAKYEKHGWIKFLLKDLENFRNALRIAIPQLAKGNIQALFNFVLGNIPV